MNSDKKAARIVAYPLSLAAPFLDMFGVISTLEGTGMILYIPGSIFEIILLLAWLTGKGFDLHAIDSRPVMSQQG